MSRLKFYYRIDHNGEPISGSNVRRYSKPKLRVSGNWRELKNPCCESQLIECYCDEDFRFFVQLDGNNNPVDYTLIKRKTKPQRPGFKYMEVPKETCCTFNLNFDVSDIWVSNFSKFLLVDNTSLVDNTGAFTIAPTYPTTGIINSGITPKNLDLVPGHYTLYINLFEPIDTGGYTSTATNSASIDYSTRSAAGSPSIRYYVINITMTSTGVVTIKFTGATSV